MAETTNDVGPWTDFQQSAPQATGAPWEDFQTPPTTVASEFKIPLIPGHLGLSINPDAGKAITDIMNLPGNMFGALKGALGLPGEVYQGNANVPQSANMPGGEDTSQIGNVTNLAGMGVRPSMSTFGKTMAPSEAQLEAAKTAQYTQAEKIPIALSSQTMSLLSRFTKQALGISDKLIPATSGILDDMAALPYDSPVYVQKLREFQRSLGEIKNNNADATERRSAGIALNSLNQVLERMDEMPSGLKEGTPGQAAEFSRLIREANGNNTALQISRDYNKRGMDAIYEANAANSGMNAEGRLNAKVSQILKNPKLMRGMDDNTIDALKEYNGGSRTSNVMRLVSNALGGGGGLGMVAAEGLGGYLGVPSGVLPGIGITLKSLSNKSALNKFENIGSKIRANSPLARGGEISVVQPGGILGNPPRIIPFNSSYQSESP